MYSAVLSNVLHEVYLKYTSCTPTRILNCITSSLLLEVNVYKLIEVHFYQTFLFKCISIQPNPGNALLN